MKDRINKTSICSVIFIDIIDYSKKPVAVQISEKECFNALLTEAIKDVAQNDRIIIDTGDGAAIALIGAPEEALFVSLTIRDGILRKNAEEGMHLLVRTGINLGPVRVVIDINGMPNIIGDGINVAQRVMSFAEPNQILVSRSYYEITSRLTDEITRMFAYSGVRQDKHVREHEVYVVRPLTEEGGASETGAASANAAIAAANAGHRQRYLFAGAVLLFVGIVLAGVLLPGWLFAPDKAATAEQASSSVAETTTPDTAPQQDKRMGQDTAANQDKMLTQDKVAKQDKSVKQDKTAAAKPSPSRPVDKSSASKQVAKGTSTQASSQKTQTQKTDTASAHPATKPGTVSKVEASWESFTESVKHGSDTKACSDAERALNQCH